MDHCFFWSIFFPFCFCELLGEPIQGHRDKRKFGYKMCCDLCCAPPCSIWAKVLGPQLGNMCQTTLGRPVNNGLGQEQVVVSCNSESWMCINGCVCVCVCVTGSERKMGLSAIWSAEKIPGEAEIRMCRFYQFTDWPLSWIQALFKDDPPGSLLCLQWRHTPIWECEMSHYKVCCSRLCNSYRLSKNKISMPRHVNCIPIISLINLCKAFLNIYLIYQMYGRIWTQIYVTAGVVM